MRFVCVDAEADQLPFIENARRTVLDGTGHELRCDVAPSDDPDQWAARLTEADGILLNWAMPAGVLGRSPSVRVVSFAGTGAERYVDLAEAHEQGVTVCNVPSYGANAVAEHAFALLFAVARGIAASDRALRAGRWEPTELLEVRGRRMGVVGAGPIGARVIEIARALGMDVAAWTRGPSPARAAALGAPLLELEDLFRRSDVISVHVAHTPQTEGVIGRALLGLLPEDAIVINTARAEVVDQAALLEALDSGRLRGAGLDVFSPEPPGPESPLIGHERVVSTPHSAYFTAPAARELYRIAIGNLAAFADGAARNVVTVEAG